jgi:hypothetical protein
LNNCVDHAQATRIVIAPDHSRQRIRLRRRARTAKGPRVLADGRAGSEDRRSPGDPIYSGSRHLYLRRHLP